MVKTGHQSKKKASPQNETGKRTSNEHGFAHQFYISRAWITCRKGYAESKGHICERCLARGDIVPADDVHHKIRLTPENINDPAIALNWNNLELLCRECHLAEHRKKRKFMTDGNGHVLW